MMLLDMFALYTRYHIHSIKGAVRDGPFDFLGGAWVILGVTVFFFLLPEKQVIFFLAG